MPNRHSLICRVMLLSTSVLSAQEKYATTSWGPPLEIPLYLAGNFGELRSNHFHSGIDIKTQGREGLNVLVTEDGYVSRIKVSPFGYGKAIYVRHNNGYTTVYAHLKSFPKEVEAYVKKHQYQQQKFKVELFPGPSEFKYKKGDLIGISGNSGGSVAPHLHFEIRETATEKPVNPLLFRFDIKDNIPPFITELHIYPAAPGVQVFGKPERRFASLQKSNGSYVLPYNKTVEVSGPVYFGIKAYDQLNEMHNKCGIYEVDLTQDDQPRYHHRMEKFAFSETRYLNAMVDYDQKMRKNKWVHVNHILPNNQLKIYGEKPLSGIVIPNESGSEMKYVVSDVYGNKSEVKFTLKKVEEVAVNQSTIGQKAAKTLKYDKANSFETGDVMLYMPKNILYDDLDFTFWVDDTLERALCPLYHIHDLYTPLHSYMALSIRVKDVPQNLRKYCLIVSLDEDGKIVQEGGYWKGDYIIVKTRSLGAYTVMMDSIPPKLTPINFSNGSNMSKKWSLMIKAEDNLSGVHRYDAYIDGKWALLEFDYKKKRLIHRFEDDLEKGEHQLSIVVKDKIGNTSIRKYTFTR